MKQLGEHTDMGKGVGCLRKEDHEDKQSYLADRIV